jgi:hypothetical protein
MRSTCRGSERLNRTEAKLARTLAAQVQQALMGTMAPSGPGSDQPVLTVSRAREPIAPERLAAAHPGGSAARLVARRLYQNCLTHYREELRPHDADGDDVGAAMASFAAANIQALHGVGVSAETMRQLERQLSALLRQNPTWAAADAIEQQCTFEKFAILSVFMGECAKRALGEGPAAVANVKHAARAYLQELLGIDPERLTLGPEGLRLISA